MKVDFDEWKKIHDAVASASEIYEVKSFKPWESEAGKQYITIQLMKKSE
jgi:hypothetical protein